MNLLLVLELCLFVSLWLWAYKSDGLLYPLPLPEDYPPVWYKASLQALLPSAA